MFAPKLTDEQLQAAVDAVAAHGSQAAAISVLGLSRECFRHRYREAVRQGFEPHCQALLAGDKAAAPEGSTLKGTTTLYGADGRAKLQWVKINAVLENQLKNTIEAIRSAFEESPKVDMIPAPKRCNSDLLTVYPFGDPHIGMKSYGLETGADWDIKIADRVISSAASHLIDIAPPSEYALVIPLGDLFQDRKSVV